MTIAIIGLGKMGSGFARLFASKGVEVAIGHKNPEKAAALAAEVGAKTKGGSVKEAVSQADIIIFAVRYEDTAAALNAAGDLTNKVVIDISNRLQPTSRSLRLVIRPRRQRRFRSSFQTQRS